MQKILSYVCYFVMILFASCSGKSQSTYIIAIDPSFYSIEVVGREKNIEAFLTDLIAEVAKKSKLSMRLQNVNWDTLYSGLQKNQYQGVISGLPRYNFHEDTFDFSEVFLQSGPVLVIPIGSQYDTLQKLANKEVGILSDSPAVFILEKYPNIIIRNYDLMAKMFNDLTLSVLDAALAGVLPATAFCNDLYYGKLSVVSDPMTDEGLRLITSKGQSVPLMKAFGKALHELERDGTIEKLKKKWGLPT
jgi:polar amino acid transport system substrate-binding protein